MASKKRKWDYDDEDDDDSEFGPTNKDDREDFMPNGRSKKKAKKPKSAKSKPKPKPEVKARTKSSKKRAPKVKSVPTPKPVAAAAVEAKETKSVPAWKQKVLASLMASVAHMQNSINWSPEDFNRLALDELQKAREVLVDETPSNVCCSKCKRVTARRSSGECFSCDPM